MPESLTAAFIIHGVPEELYTNWPDDRDKLIPALEHAISTMNGGTSSYGNVKEHFTVFFRPVLQYYSPEVPHTQLAEGLAKFRELYPDELQLLPLNHKHFLQEFTRNLTADSQTTVALRTLISDVATDFETQVLWERSTWQEYLMAYVKKGREYCKLAEKLKRLINQNSPMP